LHFIHIAIVHECCNIVSYYSMVTRLGKAIAMEKSSKIRNKKPKINREYMLLYRVGLLVGRGVVESAMEGNEKALAAIEKIAYTPKKKPALVDWLKRKRTAIQKANK
jgi:hypothetical protein